MKDLYEDIYKIAYKKSGIYRKVCALKDDNEVTNNIKELIKVLKKYLPDEVCYYGKNDDARVLQCPVH